MGIPEDQTLVSLTFDDALPQHLDYAGPLLEQYGFRGTFYVPLSAPALTARAEEWRALAARGHELGNHTVFHPGVSSKPSVTPGNAIERYTLDRMRMELDVANRVLRMLDGRTSRSFAYPGSYRFVGMPGIPKRAIRFLGLSRTRVMGVLHKYPELDIGATEVDYSCVLSTLFVAARGGSVEPTSESRFPPERYRVPSLTGDHCTAEQLEHVVTTRLRVVRWIVLGFHGIGGGHRLNCALEDFEGFLRFLSGRPDLLVKPFVDIAERLWPADPRDAPKLLSV